MPACPSDADRSLREDAFRDVVLFRAYLCGSMAGRFNPTKRGGTNISFSCPFMPFLAPLRLGKRMPNVFTRCSSSVESIPTPNDKESSIVSFKKDKIGSTLIWEPRKAPAFAWEALSLEKVYFRNHLVIL